MSTHRDPDRLLGAWLDLMPDEAPDRAIAAVLQATEGAPQARPLGTAVGRFVMNRVTFAATAALVVVAVGAALIFRPAPSVGPHPTAAGPSPAASPEAADVAVATDLQDDWLGPHRNVRQLGDAVGTHLRILATGVIVTASNNQSNPLIAAAATTTASSRIQLTGQGAGASRICDADAIGTYAAALSASKQTLTITTVSDPCTERSAAVSGTWWREACNGHACYGAIDPGTYGTEYFLPSMQAPDDWAPTYGAMQFTTTTPWAEAADEPTHVILVPAADYASWTADGGPVDPTGIVVLGQPGVIRDAGSCPGTIEIDPSKGRSAAALVDALHADPNLKVTDGPAMTVDGHRARVVDLRMQPASKVSCLGSKGSEEFLVTPFPDRFNWYTLGLVSTQQVRLLLVDLGAGSVVAIAIEANVASWDASLAEALPIVQSLRFN